jgi:DNA-binding IclR family transcriptional regulator
MDVLLLLHVAEAEATVVDLADRLDRRAADVRRATGNLVARGLLRPRADRTVPWGVVFKVTASGLDVLAGLDMPSSLAGARAGDGRRRPRRDPQHPRLRAAPASG